MNKQEDVMATWKKLFERQETYQAQVCGKSYTIDRHGIYPDYTWSIYSGRHLGVCEPGATLKDAKRICQELAEERLAKEKEKEQRREERREERKNRKLTGVKK